MKEYKTRTIVYCPECSKYAVDEVICEHEYSPIVFILSNDAKQVRMYCYKCQGILSKSEPHSNFNMDLLPTRKMESYRTFIDDKYTKENYEVKEFTNALNVKADEFNKKEYMMYLSTDWWKKKRSEALARDNNTCQICGLEAKNVHHLSYIHRGCEYLFELVSLCVACHEEYHDKEIQVLATLK